MPFRSRDSKKDERPEKERTPPACLNRTEFLNRAEFLRMAVTGGVYTLFSASPRWVLASALPNSSIDNLVRQSVVFDGVVNLGVGRSTGMAPLVPGHIKEITGISVGNHTTRVARIEARNRLVEANSQALLRIDRARDIETAARTGRYGIIYYVQSEADLQGSLEPLSLWKEQGIRTFQITYADSELGGGSGSDHLPLSSFGKQVVRELNRLHLVVDVSHCGKRTALDTAVSSTAPVTANHANAERLTPHSRNKSDEELKAIAATGGVVGVTNINRYLMRDASRPATVDDFVAHLDYMVEKIGIDHVGISSDSNMDGSHRYEVDYADGPLSSFARWKHVAAKFRDRGYGDVDIQKILGLNFVRVYREVLDP